MAIRYCGLWGRHCAHDCAAALGFRVNAARGSCRRRPQAKMKPKNQRLGVVRGGLVGVLVAVLLAMWGLRDRASYFYTPADITAGKAAEGQAVRLGGMVEKGSIRRESDGVTIRFVVTDGKA